MFHEGLMSIPWGILSSDDKDVPCFYHYFNFFYQLLVLLIFLMKK